MIAIIQAAAQRTAGFLNRVIEVLVTISLMALLGVIVGEVLVRNTMRITMPWMPEAVGLLLAFITFAGTSCWAYRRKFLAITSLKNKLFKTERAILLFDIFTWIILIGYTLILVTAGIQFASRALGQFSASGVFNLYYARMILPVGGALIMFQALVNLLNDLLRLFAPNVFPSGDPTTPAADEQPH